MKRDMQHAEHDVIAEQGNKAENNSIRQELACYGGTIFPPAVSSQLSPVRNLISLPTE